MKYSHIFEGNIAVKAALLSPYRTVYKLMVDEKKHDKDTNYILHLAYKMNISVEKTNRTIIEEYAVGNTHGGVLAFVSDREYEDYAIFSKNKKFIAYLDGIEDPYNFGFAIRSLYAAGCDGLILNQRNWNTAANIVAVSSAGASEHLPILINNDTFIFEKVKNDFTIVCASRDESAISIYAYNFPSPCCLCIGGEKRGISKNILTLSHQNVFIPYKQNFKNALSASSATAVIAFEMMRQNNFNTK